MIDLFKNYFIAYINNRKPSFPAFSPNNLNVRFEDTAKKVFDIIDKKIRICQNANTGSATFHNLLCLKIRFIDYENIIDQLPDRLQWQLKRCDFIAYDIDGNSFFILNELSQSNSSQTKLKDAIEQLYNTALHLTRVKEIKDFINTKEKHQCVFSNRNQTIINTPYGIADSFNIIENLLPNPIIHNNNRINNLGFDLIETDHIFI